MTTANPADSIYQKPLAEVTDFNRPFFDGLRDHRFLIPHCLECGAYHWIPYPACRSCLSLDLEWAPVSGEATLYTFTAVHRGPGAFAGDVPYTVAIGELVEQPRACLVVATLVGAAPNELQIGDGLRIAYEDIPCEDMTVYHWAPTGSA